MPVSEIVCGLLEALSVRVTAPVRVPVVVGVNFTLIVQLAPAATDLPHVPTPPKAKSPLTTGLNVSVALPVLVSVVNFTTLLVPTACLPKVSEVAERLAFGAATVLTVSVAALLVTLPAELLTVTVNCAPLSELVVAGVV